MKHTNKNITKVLLTNKFKYSIISLTSASFWSNNLPCEMRSNSDMSGLFHGVVNLQSSINNHQSTINNQQLTINNQQSSINNLQSTIVNQQSSIFNQQSSIQFFAPLPCSFSVQGLRETFVNLKLN